MSVRILTYGTTGMWLDGCLFVDGVYMTTNDQEADNLLKINGMQEVKEKDLPTPERPTEPEPELPLEPELTEPEPAKTIKKGK